MSSATAVAETVENSRSSSTKLVAERAMGDFSDMGMKRSPALQESARGQEPSRRLHLAAIGTWPRGFTRAATSFGRRQCLLKLRTVAKVAVALHDRKMTQHPDEAEFY